MPSPVADKPKTTSKPASIDNSNTNISHSGITQTVHISSPPPKKTSLLISVVVPIAVALIGSGAYVQHRYDLWSAPEKTLAETNTLLGSVREILVLTNSNQLPPEITARLKQLEQQAQAIGSNVALLQKPKDQLSSQADFWLQQHNAVVLGGTTSFGVNSENSKNGALYLTVNGGSTAMYAGGRIDYKTKGGQSCFLTYIRKSPDTELYGFKIECKS